MTSDHHARALDQLGDELDRDEGRIRARALGAAQAGLSLPDVDMLACDLRHIRILRVALDIIARDTGTSGLSKSRLRIAIEQPATIPTRAMDILDLQATRERHAQVLDTLSRTFDDVLACCLSGATGEPSWTFVLRDTASLYLEADIRAGGRDLPGKITFERRGDGPRI